MAIATVDQLVNALANNHSRVVVDKASIANTAAGQLFSLWRATGQPGQGTIPVGAALCNSAFVGAIGFSNQTAPATSYVGWASLACSNGAVSFELHDRIAHMAGLNATLLTAQTVGLNLTSAGLNPPVARLGAADFSDVSWWMEWYADGGATASNATISVTYNNGTTNTLTAVSVGGTVRASRMINLNGLIPASQSGLFIRSIDSVILSASTAAAGNFGFTATRPRTVFSLPVANFTREFDWQLLGIPEAPNDSCLMLIQLASTSTTGTLRGFAKIAHG
jgi:hypothetical protein